MLLAAASAAAAPRWQRIEAGRWELISEGGEKGAAQTLRQLMEVQSALAAEARAFALDQAPAPPPVRVFLFRSAKDFRPFQRGESNRGIFQSGADHDYIFLTPFGEDTQRAAFHELVHLTMFRAAGPMPQWLEEGLAEYYSTLQRVGARIVIGRPVAAHVRLLAGEGGAPGAWPDPIRFLTARDETEVSAAAGPGRTSLYYALSWGLTHVLMSQEGSAAGLSKFLRLLREGVSQPAAFEDAFGKSPANAMAEVRQALSLNRFPERSVVPPAAVIPPASPSNAMTEAEFESLRAGALLASGNLSEAERVYREAARKWPNDASAIAGLGYLAMRRSDYDTARRQLEAAIAAGSREAATHFEYAMLVRDTKGPEALVVQSLRQAVSMSESYAAAWYALGAALMRQGQAAEAADCLRRAISLEPRNAVYWESYGRARLAQGDRAAAREASRAATLAAGTPEQAAMAQGLLRDADAPAPARPSVRPGVITPKGWEPPQGDATVDGRLALVDCDTPELKFHIETQPATAKTAARKTILSTTKPNQVMLRGAGSQKREFVCGPQPAKPPVAAGYIARPPEAAPPPPPPVPEPKPVPPPKKGSAKKAPPPKRAPAAKPAKPAPPPVAGELVWLEFKEK